MKFFQNCKKIALLAVLTMLTGCGPSDKDVVAAVEAAMLIDFPTDFAKLKFEDRSYRAGLNPTMVFQGKTARVVVVTKPKKWDNMLAADEVTMSGIALTKNGRYFHFTYKSPLLAPTLPFWSQPCVEDGCRYFEHAQPISRAGAMAWFFDSDEFTPERFKELFDEEAPARTVEA